jgi:hypothetical protein
MQILRVSADLPGTRRGSDFGQMIRVEIALPSWPTSVTAQRNHRLFGNPVLLHGAAACEGGSAPGRKG